jgi:hypothetical protein
LTVIGPLTFTCAGKSASAERDFDRNGINRQCGKLKFLRSYRRHRGESRRSKKIGHIEAADIGDRTAGMCPEYTKNVPAKMLHGQI